MPLQTLIGPAARPIDVIEARNHVRQDLTADDTVLDIAIRATTSFAQAECLRTLVATRYRLVLDSFPGPSLMGVPWGRSYSLPGHAICLEYGPVLAVKWVKYLDTAGVQQAMPATDYTVDLSGPVARITPVFGKIWPIPLSQIGAVEVVYDAGDAAAITADAMANTITVKGGLWKTLAVGDTVRLSNSGGALPAPLQPDTDYFVQSIPGAVVYTLAATSGDLAKGTARASLHLPGYGGHVPAAPQAGSCTSGGSARTDHKSQALLFSLDQYSRGRLPKYTGAGPAS